MIGEQLSDRLASYGYRWPSEPLADSNGWRKISGSGWLEHPMPESREQLARDSRWPAFFPCAISIVTASDGRCDALEKVVGASIVNRFPYIVALSFCTNGLSSRHHPRSRFMEVLGSRGEVAIQFIAPGPNLDRVMRAISDIAESASTERIARTGLHWTRGITNQAPVCEDAYLVYEASLVKPGQDVEGAAIFKQPFLDVGSHRIFFFEISAIQLRRDIADGTRQIAWRSLPRWAPQDEAASRMQAKRRVSGYQKGYTPHYRFPSAGTIAFRADGVERGMAVKYLPRQTLDEVRALSNDDARWPCFFPSSLGMITSVSANGRPNLMPCGSTTVVSRHPMAIAICISYAEINERYAPRASLRFLRDQGAFGCGVAYIDDQLIDAIKYAGNTSIADDEDKLSATGLHVTQGALAPLLPALPVHFECRVVGEHRLGTHAMFVGEVQRVLVRRDVTSANPLEWCPWADVVQADG